MRTHIKKKTTISSKDNLIFLCNKRSDISNFNLSEKEMRFVKSKLNSGEEIITINQYDRMISIVAPKKEENKYNHDENIRLLGDKLLCNISQFKSIVILDVEKNRKNALLLAEGIALGNYTYNKHKTNPNPNKLEYIYVYTSKT